MSTDWIAVAAIGAMLIAGLTLLSRIFDKSVSLREHEEYKTQQDKQDGLRDKAVDLQTANLRRDIVRIESRLDSLEMTRPTAGQLQDATTNLKERLLDKMIPR